MAGNEVMTTGRFHDTGTLVAACTAACVLLFGIAAGGRCNAVAPPPAVEIVPAVEVERKYVSLLDLCRPGSIASPWKERLEAEHIGQSPNVGEYKYILGKNLRAYLDRFFSRKGCDPAAIEMSLPDKITIARAALKLSAEQIEAIYREFVLSRSPWNPNDLQISRIYFPGVPALPLGRLSHEVYADSQERFLGNVTVTIQFFVDGAKERSMRVTGKVDLYQNVLHAIRPLGKDEVVAAGDLEIQRINIADNPDRYATRMDQVIGKQLVRGAGAHQPIFLGDVIQPNVVKHGGIVTIIYQDGGLKLTAKGKVSGNASVGDTVRVTNLMTQRTAICRVQDGETVHVVH